MRLNYSIRADAITLMPLKEPVNGGTSVVRSVIKEMSLLVLMFELLCKRMMAKNLLLFADTEFFMHAWGAGDKVNATWEQDNIHTISRYLSATFFNTITRR